MERRSVTAAVVGIVFLIVVRNVMAGQTYYVATNGSDSANDRIADADGS